MFPDGDGMALSVVGTTIDVVLLSVGVETVMVALSVLEHGAFYTGVRVRS